MRLIQWWGCSEPGDVGGVNPRGERNVGVGGDVGFGEVWRQPFTCRHKIAAAAAAAAAMPRILAGATPGAAVGEALGGATGATPRAILSPTAP